ncbi:hypothetical protein ARAM_005360 [Aspergillus rambellii]|uniref:HRQ family protein n=1 Tax=Aspergillus rambellii TaxID=308745 RepID=A0A0F8U6R1_9EURO|nr:hypothetical protein ARAM_005360 [Aspergillus rambellii]
MASLFAPDKLWFGIALLTLTGACIFLLTFGPGPGPGHGHNNLHFIPRLRRRRTSTSETPPRSIPPAEKKPPVPTSPSPSPSTKSKSPIHAATVVPPQRRHILAALPRTAPSYKEVHEDKVKARLLLRLLLPMTADYSAVSTELYTCTGFSTTDLSALGDFPDYATLSGVPLPRAYAEFDIERALARPYRPFRWAYHQTMSFTKLEPDWWLELENTYKLRIAQRKALYAKHGRDVLDYLPGSELACKELMEMVVQFLCARYPHYFSLRDNRILENKILATERDVRTMHPLEVILENIPEDFAIMLRDDKTGNYFFRAGVICSTLGWNLQSKIGLQLHEIHDPVPDYKEKMQFSMDRFFTKMPADKPIQRGSWGIEVGQPLYVPPGHPHEKLRLSQDPTRKLEDCNLRVDWQTLRRLPLSGAVVFNFKALFTPLTEFRDEPGVPALLAKILHEGKKNLMEYKGTWHLEHVVLPKFEEWAREQEEKGLVPKNWEVATLDESPWFKGWQEKWRRQQGF